ncbi:hypothetical protein GHT06_016921 [Daphnia sinensis]|uniref:Uncharacterized protein n=1 Tax=Daphnia sinensis TaxID=1820382 RepID=A0AAD5L7H2_9CRUS|nr:hypothetical protein GHT06_016921 [Daphnia sinensis]
MAKKKTSILASRSQPKSKPKLTNRKGRNKSVVSYNGTSASIEDMQSNISSCKVKRKYQGKQNTARIATNCREGKDSSNQNPGPIYESELERTERLRMAKLKPSSKKHTSFKQNTTSSYGSLRQGSTVSQTANASDNPLQSNSNLSACNLTFKIGDKANSLVDNLTSTKPKTVNIWKFNDGTTVKKIY